MVPPIYMLRVYHSGQEGRNKENFLDTVANIQTMVDGVSELDGSRNMVKKDETQDIF